MKLVLTVLAIIVLLPTTQTIRSLAALASSGDPRALPGSLLHSVGGLFVLLTITVLSIYKPRGLTRYGWRRQQEERRSKQQARRPGAAP